MRVTFHGSSGQNAPGLGAILSKTGNLSLTSRRCSISRPTLRKWVSRYQEAGVTGVA
jgi:transposase-like protein